MVNTVVSLLALAGMSALATYALVRNRRARLVRRARILARPTMDRRQWYQVHFADTGVRYDVASDIVQRLARVLGVDATQLRPTDSFDAELRFDGVSLFGFDADCEMERLHEVEIPSLVGVEGAAAYAKAAPSIRTILDLAQFCQLHVSPSSRSVAGETKPDP